jgi:hypothetical protein
MKGQIRAILKEYLKFRRYIHEQDAKPKLNGGAESGQHAQRCSRGLWRSGGHIGGPQGEHESPPIQVEGIADRTSTKTSMRTPK